MLSSAYVWAKVLGQLESKIPSISSWFDDCEVVEFTGQTLVLFTPTEFRRDFIVTKAAGYIADAIRELFSMEVTVQVLSEQEKQALEQNKRKSEPILFNSQFTFENFVVGASNRFAHAAALAVANKPAESYNPLYIYGPSGLGKTHLLYAIANEIHRQHPDFKIVYIKGDQFTNELISALQEGKNMEFRSKYRGADLFLVDDIQFIAGKTSTQEEFFHTFNTLYEARRQIVLTSDRPPKEMTALEDRLKTRFEWGLLADIQPPDYETRMAIIKNKAMQLGTPLPDSICTYIAENVTANVRQIEGTVKKILAYRELLGNDIDEESTARAVRDMLKKDNEFVPSASLVISEISKYYNLEERVLRGQQRFKEAATARQVAMYLIRRLTNLSLSEIGKEFDGRDHTTVMHSIEKVEKQMNKSPAFAETVKAITANINAKN